MEKLIILHLTGGGPKDGDYRSDDPEHAEWAKHEYEVLHMPGVAKDEVGKKLEDEWKVRREFFGEAAQHHYRVTEMKEVDGAIHIHMIYKGTSQKLP